MDEFIKDQEHVLAWLLQSEQPSVVYYSLTRLLNKKEEDLQVRQARQDIMHKGVVTLNLAKQN